MPQITPLGRTEAILKEQKSGKTLAQIGKIFKISRQRVFQIIKEYKDKIELPTGK